jgi:hypothetical protein
MAIVPQEASPPDGVVTIKEAPTPQDIEDQAALDLVVSDAQSAMSWIEGQQWNECWRVTDMLYDSPRTFATWDSGTLQPQVQRYTLAEHVNSLHPQMMEGIFYSGSETECFTFEPRPGTEADVARARATVINVQMDQMEFEQEVALGLFQGILHGTGIFKWGIETVEEIEYEYKRKAPPLTQDLPLIGDVTTATEESDEFEEVENKRTVTKPFFKWRENREILVDPKLKHPDIRRAKFVIDKYYATLDDLLAMRNDPNYDMPSEEEIKSWFDNPKEQPAVLGNLDSTTGSPSIGTQGQPDWLETSIDPYEEGLMILERTDCNRIITVLNNKKVIQNRPNKYGVINYYSWNWYNRIRAFWGLGCGRIVGTDQRLQQGLENSGLALLQLIMDPPFVVEGDDNVPSQNVRLRKGAIVKIKKDGKIYPMEMPKMPLGEIFAFLQNSSAKAEAADGANSQLVQGAVPGQGGKTSLTRTAGGAQQFGAAVATRLQGPVGHFVQQVLVPFVYQLDTLNRRFVPMNQVRTILGDELGPSFKFDESKFLNGKVEFDCLAGAHLASRKIMAQALPLLTQIFDNPQILEMLADNNQEYVDVKEMLLMWLEATGWRNRKSLIKPMNQDMIARRQQKQAQAAGAMKIQAQGALENQKHQNRLGEQDQKQALGTVRDLIDKSYEQGGDYLLRQAEEKAPALLGAEGE